MPARQELGYIDEDFARYEGEAKDPRDYRRPFARDYDRLIHTAAFRRLQGKTQVVTPGEADFFRTRLTHTLEVAQIARRIAETLDVDADLTEAAAILHDLGHPPFGHAGETALCQVVDEVAEEWDVGRAAVGGFNGNAQNFRLAAKTLRVRGGFPGLDLTRGTLDGAIKYPWQRETAGVRKSKKSWCFYPTEAAHAEWLREVVPTDRRYKKSLEAQIVEWADDVAYSIHDVEDWYRAGLMPLDSLTQSSEQFQAFVEFLCAQLLKPDKPAAQGEAEPAEQASLPDPVAEEEDAPTAEAIEEQAGVLFKESTFLGLISQPYDGSRAAKERLRVARKALFSDLVDGVDVADPSAPRRRHENDLKIPPDPRLRCDILRQLLWFFVVPHPRMGTHQHGQRRVAEGLARIHYDALGFDPEKRSWKMDKDPMGIYPIDARDALREGREQPAELIRLVADHIAGMTDSYALRIYNRLSGHDPGAFNAFV